MKMMVVSEEQIGKVVQVLVGYGATEVYLFGQEAGLNWEHYGVGFATRGIPDERYYSAVGAAMVESGLEINLIDLDREAEVARNRYDQLDKKKIA